MQKKIVKIILGLLVLGAILVVGLLWSINPILEKLKPQLTAKISEALKAPVEFGSVGVRFVPSLGIEINDISLSEQKDNANSSAGGASASIGKLILRTGLFELISGTVTVSQFELHDTSLTVTRRDDGSLALGSLVLVPAKSAQPQNFRDTTATDPAADSANASSSASASSESGAASASSASSASSNTVSSATVDKNTSVAFALKSAVIEKFNISFRDQMTSPETLIELQNLSAAISNLGSTEKGTIDLTASLLGKSPDNLKINGTAMLPQAGQVLPELDITLALEAIDLARIKGLAQLYGAKIEQLTLNDQASYRLGIKVDKTGISVTPALDATQATIGYGELFSKASGTELSLSAKINPTLFGAVQTPEAAVKIAGIELSTPFSFNPLTGGSFSLKTITFPLSELEKFLPLAKDFSLKGNIAADITAKVPAKLESGVQPPVNGKIELQGVSAAIPLGGNGGKNSPGKTVLPLTAVNGSITLNGNAVAIKPLSLVVANQQISISAEIKELPNFKSTFEISSQSLALDQLLSAVNPEQAAALANSKIDGLKISGGFAQGSRSGTVIIKSDSGQVANATFKALGLQIAFVLDPQMKPDSVLVKDGSLAAFGGALNFNARLKNASQLTTTVNATNMNLEELSKLALAGSPITVAGAMQSFDANIAADIKDALNTLSGTVSSKLASGEIRGFNLLKETLGKLDKIPGIGNAAIAFVPEKYRPLLQANSTKFDSIYLKTNLAGDTIGIESFDLKQELYILTGSGKAKVDGSLDLEAQFRLTAVLAEDMALKEPKLELLMDRNRSIVFPVLIKKSAGGVPVVLPDASKLLSRAAENTAKEAGKKALDRISPGLGKTLDSLFK